MGEKLIEKMREIIPYNPKLKELARQLRQNMTLSEVLLWDCLKQKQMLGFDFDRQKPLDEFIVDFYCKDLKLAIEIDGDSHDSEEAYKADLKRQKKLEDLGVHFLRFGDLEVKKDMSNVLRTIEGWIKNHKERPTPNPSEEGNATISQFLEIAKLAAKEAGEEIIRIYESGDFSIEAKSDDSPLTKADKASHEAIVAKLESTGLPILSEEGREIPYAERKGWDLFWMIDPLDGTKEFIKKNGEFTVNIALIQGTEVVLGVVYTPVLNELFWAVKEEGAYKDGKKITASKANLTDECLRIVASRSHLNEETSSFIEGFKNPEIVSKGSSLKLLMVAEGAADLYPRYAPTMEWDTAAAQIVVEEAGGQVLVKNSSEKVRYNKENLLNPHFLVQSNITE